MYCYIFAKFLNDAKTTNRYAPNLEGYLKHFPHMSQTVGSLGLPQLVFKWRSYTLLWVNVLILHSGFGQVLAHNILY